MKHLFLDRHKEVHGPERFPKFPQDQRALRDINGHSVPRPSTATRGLSQSERDWAFAKRALARGDTEELVIAAIAVYRRFDKHNPQAYAERTVQKAAADLDSERAANRQLDR
jgi:hypothetical protein